MSETTYSSVPETLKHIDQVRMLMHVAINDLRRRAANHDASKMESPEVEAFDIISPRLHGVTYGSEEYRATMKEFKPALDHHVQNNDHHPEFFGDEGVLGMGALQLLEMCCDWIAASRRHADGDILKSLAYNQTRFGYDAEVYALLRNTILQILALEP